MNSDLTREIQSSINDMCQCTLPSYTLRGSIDLCDPKSKSSCAIYTGRLLGSDEASANQVFEMVQDWLASQNGSILNGALSVDPNCTLRRLSPSDAVCSAPMSNSVEEEEVNTSSDSRNAIEVIQMLAIGIGSGFAIIICSLITCVCVCALHKKIKKRGGSSSEVDSKILSYTQSQDTQHRHYSVIVERNPSYNRHHNKAVGPIQQTIFNGGRLEATSALADNLHCDDLYAYTSLKTASRQADPPVVNITQETAHLTVEQLGMIPPRHSQTSNNGYVIGELSSPSDVDSYTENNTSTFLPVPTVAPTSNSRGVYLSVS